MDHDVEGASDVPAAGIASGSPGHLQEKQHNQTSAGPHSAQSPSTAVHTKDTQAAFSGDTRPRSTGAEPSASVRTMPTPQRVRATAIPMAIRATPIKPTTHGAPTTAAARHDNVPIVLAASSAAAASTGSPAASPRAHDKEVDIEAQRQLDSNDMQLVAGSEQPVEPASENESAQTVGVAVTAATRTATIDVASKSADSDTRPSIRAASDFVQISRTHDDASAVPAVAPAAESSHVPHTTSHFNERQRMQCLRLVRDLSASRAAGARLAARQDQLDQYVGEEIETALFTIRTLSDKCSSQKQDMKLLRGQICDLEREHDELATECTDRQLLIDSMRDHRDTLMETVELGASDLARAKRDLATTRSEICRLREIVVAKDSAVRVIENQLEMQQKLLSAASDASTTINEAANLVAGTFAQNDKPTRQYVDEYTMTDDIVAREEPNPAVSDQDSTVHIPLAPSVSVAASGDVSTSNRIVDGLRLELETTKGALRSLQATHESMRAQLEAREAECARLTHAVMDLENEKAAIESKFDEKLVSIVAQAGKEIRIAPESTDAPSPGIDDLRAQLSAKEALISVLRQQKEDVEHATMQKIQAAQQDAQRHAAENQILRRENQGLHAMLEKRGAETATLDHERKMLEAQNQGWQLEVERLRQQNTNLAEKDDEIARLSRKIENMQRETIDLRREHDVVREAIKRKASDERQVLTDEINKIQMSHFQTVSRAMDALTTLSGADLALRQYPVLSRAVERLRAIETDELETTLASG